MDNFIGSMFWPTPREPVAFFVISRPVGKKFPRRSGRPNLAQDIRAAHATTVRSFSNAAPPSAVAAATASSSTPAAARFAGVGSQ